MRKMTGRILASFLSAALFFLPASSYSAARTEIQLFFSSAGGMNDSTNPLNFPPGDMLEAKNVSFDVIGAWTTRLGIAKYNTSAISGTPIVTSIFEWVQS